MPTYWKEPDRTPISSDEAVRLWAAEAHEILLGVAAHYNKVIRAGELISRVQASTGVLTDIPATEWLPRVLHQIVHRCHATGEPPLTSLVINALDGKVGVAYAEVLRLQGLTVTNALGRERQAAKARLDCYRAFAKDVPANATPQLSPALQRVVPPPARARAASRTVLPVVPDKPLNRICPTCFLETPITGECQNCM